VVIGTLVSFGAVLYALLDPTKAFGSFEICLAASLLGFLYSIKKIL